MTFVFKFLVDFYSFYNILLFFNFPTKYHSHNNYQHPFNTKVANNFNDLNTMKFREIINNFSKVAVTPKYDKTKGKTQTTSVIRKIITLQKLT